MPKTHEINLEPAEFEKFKDNNYIILQSSNIEVGDYILFKQEETNLHRMALVNSVIHSEGLKDGYVLVIVNKL